MTWIAIIGDWQPENETHRATRDALAHVDATWIATDEVTPERLGGYDGLWIAPGSPYRDLDGALEAIRHAREQDVPLVGT